mgnify:CR=1 FL=1
MTPRHGNRVRRVSGDDVNRELRAAEACEQCRSSDPTREEIERRAYQLYLDRNGLPGDPVADWLQAEAELRARQVDDSQID